MCVCCGKPAKEHGILGQGILNNDMYIELPENVKKHYRGAFIPMVMKAYAVGGCVRDSVLGRKPKDWDITTSALPQEVKSLFKKRQLIQASNMEQ